MKTLQIIDSLDIGGAQKLLVTLAEVVRSRNESVTVVTLSEPRDPFILDALREREAEVIVVASGRLLDLRRFRRLQDTVSRSDCEVVHTHLITSNILGGLAGRRSGVAVVASLHNTARYSGKNARPKQWLEYRTLAHCARRVIAVGRNVAEAHRNRIPISLDIVDNAVPLIEPLADEERCRRRQELLGPAAGLMVFSAGRLTEQKGYDLLLRAAAPLLRERRDVHLVIAGDGPSKPELLRLKGEVDPGNQVRLLGARHDVEQLLQMSDLFVSSSRWEGLPIALLEAMAAGLPVVATDVGDVAGAVGDAAGLLVPPEDELSLRHALAQLIGDPGRRRALGASARRRIESHHSAETWYAQLHEIYRAAAQNQPLSSS